MGPVAKKRLAEVKVRKGKKQGALISQAQIGNLAEGRNQKAATKAQSGGTRRTPNASRIRMRFMTWRSLWSARHSRALGRSEVFVNAVERSAAPRRKLRIL
jgi:hypothetical protein